MVFLVVSVLRTYAVWSIPPNYQPHDPSPLLWNVHITPFRVALYSTVVAVILLYIIAVIQSIFIVFKASWNCKEFIEVYQGPR